ncbi:MAG: hypothetical protein P8J45_00195 [Phycisphaerales bacterium]|jgi:hypothetical protein|nr:hypothetical protein [Phycisphaerales bacterium]
MLPIILIVLILIIAGAIARQGMLSSFLHMICVISAGAIALGLLEPIGFGLLDSVGGFAAYMAGTSLILIFLISLLVLRLSMDSLVPDNLNFNKTVDWVGAGIFAVCGSFISVGIVVLGVGLLQFVPNGFGYEGWVRDRGTGRPAIEGTPMYPAVLTARFYEFLSMGSLAPTFNSGSLGTYRPNIDQASWSLARDSFDGTSGNSRAWIQPKSVKISPNNGFIYSADLDPAMFNPDFPRFEGAYVVSVEVDVTGFDNGNEFTMSTSQARLIAPPTASGRKPRVGFPVLFSEPTKQGIGFFAFDDPSNFISSMPGQQKIAFRLFFPKKDIGEPLSGKYFLELKQLRLELPTVEVVDVPGSAVATSNSTTNSLPTGDGGPLPPGSLEFSSVIGLKLSYNQRGSLVINDDNKVTSGVSEFPTNAPSGGVSRKLRVENFYEPLDTRIAQITVRRGSSLDTERIKRDGGGDEPMLLVDSKGQTYYPAGFIKRGPKITLVSFNPASLVMTIDELPNLPSSGNTDLILLYRVPVGAILRELRAGDDTLASMSRKVPNPK